MRQSEMLSHLKIGTRLGLGFGLMLALLSLMAGIVTWQMSRLQDNVLYYSANIVPSSEVQKKIDAELRELRILGFRHVLANTDAEMDSYEASMEQLRKGIAADFDNYAKDLLSDDEDKRDMDASRAATEAYIADWQKVQPISRKTANNPAMTEEANRLMSGPANLTFQAATTALEKWWNYNVKLSVDQDKDSRETYFRARLILASLLASALALGVTAALFITRSITLPMQRAVQMAETVAAGDLTLQLDTAGKDETAKLLQALERMNTSLAEIVKQVRNSSDSIATGSAQIAAGNADLSQRTEEQASNLEETAASMEELSSTVRTNADTASQANTLANSAAAAAANGSVAVGHVVATMQEIAESSRKISDIISVIDGIAFQTNILALNAAVEAARAGEQGRGFAVVASEVRSLASRSANAAREIKALIGASVGKVEEGARQVKNAGETMGEIVAQVQRVTHLIKEISSATSEQASGISQVGDAVTQLDNVTQQNAALVEQSAAAAESLKAQASELARIVSVFKLVQSHGRDTPAANVSAPIERRSAHRATNVTRPKFGARSGTTTQPASSQPVKTGTDTWESF
jgi:methyl-accepting chemotaxis protein